MGGSTDALLDVAVVGGGISGTFVAHRLRQARPDCAVTLFEASDRIGGRLLSLRVAGVRSRRAELGGMRFRTSQPIVSGLVAELGLDTRPFLTVRDDNRFFLRGGRWRLGEPELAAAHYSFGEHEGPLSPADLLLAAFERIVPGALDLDEAGWARARRTASHLGRPLRDWTLGDALASVLTPDGHRYVLDGFGYASVLADRNAAAAIPWVLIEARPEEENRTIVAGMEQLPRAVADRFERAGGTVERQRALVGFDVDGDEVHMRFDRGGPARARRLVLALPRLALEAVADHSPVLSTREVRALLGTVTGHPASKLAAVYDRAWWRDDGRDAARVVCDLDLSKVFYFDDPVEPGGPAILLASYADGPARDAWCARAPGWTMPEDGDAADAPGRWDRYAATAAQVADAQLQLAELHDRATIPAPAATAFVDWGAPPFGAAWHFWDAGLSSSEVAARMIQPCPDLPVFVCGEAYSSSQGWVEGALESATAVLLRLAGRG